jgi:hypothetical protein
MPSNTTIIIDLYATAYDYFYSAIKGQPCEAQLIKILDLRIKDGILPGTSFEDHIRYDFEANIPRDLVEYLDTFNYYFYDKDHIIDPAYQYIADTIFNYYNENMEELINTTFTDPVKCMATFQNIDNIYSARFEHIIDTIVRNKKTRFDGTMLREFETIFGIDEDDLDNEYSNAILNPKYKVHTIDTLKDIYSDMLKRMDIKKYYANQAVMNAIQWRMFAPLYKFINDETTRKNDVLEKFGEAVETQSGEDDKLGFKKMFADIETICNTITSEINKNLDEILKEKVFTPLHIHSADLSAENECKKLTDLRILDAQSRNSIEAKNKFIDFKIKQITETAINQLQIAITPELLQLIKTNMEVNNTFSKMGYKLDIFGELLNNIVLCGADQTDETEQTNEQTINL